MFTNPFASADSPASTDSDPVPSGRLDEQDITEERQVLRALVENSHDFIVVARVDGQVLYLNHASLSLTGMGTDTTRQHCLSDFVSAENHALLRDVILPTLRDGGPWRGRLLLHHSRTDKAIVTDAIGFVCGRYQDHTPKYVAIVARDARDDAKNEAAQREAAENYRELFENATVGIFQTAPQGYFRKANPALARILGYSSPAELMSALSDIRRQLYVEPDRRTEFERMLHEKAAVSDFEMRAYRKDGSVIWASVQARAIRDGGGVLLYYEGFVEDISAQKTLKTEQDRIFHEALERADRDPLTGLLNHPAFYRRLAEETARAERDNTSLAVVLLDLDNFKFFNDVYGHAAGDEVLLQVAQRLQAFCHSRDTVARFGGDEFALLLTNTAHDTRTDIEARLKGGLGRLGHHPGDQETAIPITASVGAALFPNHSVDRYEVVRLAEERLRRAKTGGTVESEAERVRVSMLNSLDGFSMLDALVTAVDNKDRYTRRHSEDVMAYSLMVAHQIGIDETTRRTIAVAALLHDVGKIGIPDNILRKPGRLTMEEFEAVKKHPQMGAIIVSAVPGLEETLDAVRHHHERWDGQGYPFGLEGEECPLLARLMAVADAFSAMTMDRPYRQGMSRGQALTILAAGAGTQWDPQCAHGLIQAMQETLPANDKAA